MSFEPLKQKLLDRNGRQVTDSVQATIVRAFEIAATVPDANLDHLVRGAARVARVISDGRADKPDEYATTVLGRIAWRSQRQFVSDWQLAAELGMLEVTARCRYHLARARLRKLTGRER